MRHEKIIKRPDGRVKIEVDLFMDTYFGSKHRWSFRTYWCPKGKRTWTTHVNHDDFSWRRLTSEQRIEEDHRRCLKLATPEEIHTAMLELWEKFRPSVPEITP